MADILQGTADTSGSAPLTGAQTVAICKHLQEEIREVESSTAAEFRELHHTTADVQRLKEKEIAAHDEMHTLAVGLSQVNTDMLKIQSEVGRIFEAVVQLQISDQNSKEKVVQLEEGRKMVDTRLDLMSKDIAAESASGKTLRGVIEKRINDDFRVMLKDMASTKLLFAQFQEEIGLVTKAEQEDRDLVRQANIKIDDVLHEVKKSNTVTNILENRLASAAKGIQATWAKTNEFANELVKLQECYDKSKLRIVDVEGSIKEVNDAGKKTQQEVEDQLRVIEANKEGLKSVWQVVNSGGNDTQELRHMINAVQQNADNNGRSIMSVANKLKVVEEIAFAATAGLKEQSSMLLPNIHMDSQDSVEASQRHGSLLMSHGVPGQARGGGGSRGTPRARAR